MRANTALMQTLGDGNIQTGNVVLADIISKNIAAPCNTCQNNQDYLEKMDVYLKSVEYFVTTFGKNKNQGSNRSGYVFSSGITSGSPWQVKGAAYMLKVLNQNRSLVPSTAIFEYDQFTGCEADILAGNKIYEFKTWSPRGNDDDNSGDRGTGYNITYSSFWNFERGYKQFEQFLCYLRNIKSLNELEYVFDKENIEKTGDANTVAQNYVRQKFQVLFQTTSNSQGRNQDCKELFRR